MDFFQLQNEARDQQTYAVGSKRTNKNIAQMNLGILGQTFDPVLISPNVWSCGDCSVMNRRPSFMQCSTVVLKDSKQRTGAAVKSAVCHLSVFNTSL